MKWYINFFIKVFVSVFIVWAIMFLFTGNYSFASLGEGSKVVCALGIGLLILVISLFKEN